MPPEFTILLNCTFTENIKKCVRVCVITCHSVFHVWPRTTLSASVAQRRQRSDSPARVCALRAPRGPARLRLPDAEAPGEACGSTQLRKWVGAPGFLDREVAEGSGSFYT